MEIVQYVIDEFKYKLGIDLEETMEGSDKMREYNLEMKKLHQALKKLKPVYLYLTTSPSEGFVQSELERVSSSVKNAESAFPKWKNDVYNRLEHGGDPKGYYYKMMQISEMKKQVKTLMFVLGTSEKL